MTPDQEHRIWLEQLVREGSTKPEVAAKALLVWEEFKEMFGPNVNPPLAAWDRLKCWWHGNSTEYRRQRDNYYHARGYGP